VENLEAAFSGERRVLKKTGRLPLLFFAILTIIIAAASFFVFFKPSSLTPISREGFALDTYVRITVYDSDSSQGQNERLLDECFNLLDYYENMLSRTIPASEVYALNHSDDYVKISPEVYALLEKAAEYSRKTNQLYDITIAPLVALWDITNPNPHVPDESAIKKALIPVSYTNIALSADGKARLKNGAQIDLGSIAKGYIADVIASHLKSKGINSAIIDLGGNISAVGKKNGNTDWKIGIAEPFSENGGLMGYFEVSDISVVTSGIYQRYFYENGEIYHHIIDPRTGFPVKSGLISVSVVSASATDADALSTSCLLLGEISGMALIEATPDTEAIFITDSGEVLYSSGIGSRIKYVSQKTS